MSAKGINGKLFKCGIEIPKFYTLLEKRFQRGLFMVPQGYLQILMGLYAPYGIELSPPPSSL
jgi:hypothetical protein